MRTGWVGPTWTVPRAHSRREERCHKYPRGLDRVPAIPVSLGGRLGGRSGRGGARNAELAAAQGGFTQWRVRLVVPRGADGRSSRGTIMCSSVSDGAGERQAEAIAPESSLSWAAQVGMASGLHPPCTPRKLELLGCAIDVERALHRTVLDQAGLERGWAADVAEAFRPKLKRVRQASRLATVLGCAQALRARVEAECGEGGPAMSCNEAALRALLRGLEPALERRIEGAVGGGLAQGLAGLMQRVHLGGHGESWHESTARVLVNEARALADEVRVTDAVSLTWNRGLAASEDYPELAPGLVSVAAMWELILFCYEGEEGLEAEEQDGEESDGAGDLCEVGVEGDSKFDMAPQYSTGEGGRRVWGKDAPGFVKESARPLLEGPKSAATSQYVLAQELAGFAGALLDGLLVLLVEKLLVEQKQDGGAGEDLDRAEAEALAIMVTMCNRCGCEAIFLRHFGSTRLTPLAHPALWGALAGRRVAAGLQRELEGFTRKDKEPGYDNGVNSDIPTPGALVVFGLYEYLGQCAAESAAAHPEGGSISLLVDHCSGGYVVENPAIWRVNQYAAFVDLVRGELAWWSRPLQDEKVLDATLSSLYGSPLSVRPDASLRDAQELGAQLLQGPPSPASVAAGITAYTRVCLSRLGEKDIPHAASFVKEVERLLAACSGLATAGRGSPSTHAFVHGGTSASLRRPAEINFRRGIEHAVTPEDETRPKVLPSATSARKPATVPLESGEGVQGKKVRARPSWVSANVDGLKQRIRNRKKVLSSGEALYAANGRGGKTGTALTKTDIEDSLAAFDAQLEALDAEIAKFMHLGHESRVQRLMALRGEARQLRESLAVKGQRRLDAIHRRGEVIAVGRDIEKLEEKLRLVNASSKLRELSGKGASNSHGTGTSQSLGVHEASRGQTIPELEGQIEGAKAVWKQLHDLESKVEGEEDSLRFAKGLDDMNELIANVRTTVSTIGRLQDHIHQIERPRPLSPDELRHTVLDEPVHLSEAELLLDDEIGDAWVRANVRGTGGPTDSAQGQHGLLATTIQTLKEGGEWFSTASQLLGHDVRESVSLLQWSSKGGRLTPRERRVLWRTAGDLLSAVPVATIMVLPLTPVGHALALGFLQKRAPSLLPTAFGDPERVAQYLKLERIKQYANSAAGLGGKRIPSGGEEAGADEPTSFDPPDEHASGHLDRRP